MPELPDLLYIRKYLRANIERKTITAAAVKQPVVLRIAVDRQFDDAVSNRVVAAIDIHGPFFRFELSDSIDIIINLMLSGKLQHQREGEKPEGYLCCSFLFDDGSRLNLCDENKMAKLYVVHHGIYERIPKYTEQGIDVRSPGFTPETFKELVRRHSRKQVRVFINDHTALSSIGNAYADEILFDARIHPKTFVSRLNEEEISRLYSSVVSVIEWGIRKVEEAGQAIQVKVRDHMKVRNRRGEPCPRCGTTIRREGVRGHDTFFCPQCQRASRHLFIDWNRAGSDVGTRSSG